MRVCCGQDCLLLGVFARSLSDYEISIPVRVNTAGQFISHSLQYSVSLSSSQRRCRRSSVNTVVDRIDYRLRVAGNHLHLTLEPSWNLCGPGLVVERRQADRSNLTDSTRLSTDIHSRLCHFQGKIRGRSDSTVAISTCNGLVGYFNTTSAVRWMQVGSSSNGMRLPIRFLGFLVIAVG